MIQLVDAYKNEATKIGSKVYIVADSYRDDFSIKRILVFSNKKRAEQQFRLLVDDTILFETKENRLALQLATPMKTVEEYLNSGRLTRYNDEGDIVQTITISPVAITDELHHVYLDTMLEDTEDED